MSDEKKSMFESRKKALFDALKKVGITEIDMVFEIDGDEIQIAEAWITVGNEYSKWWDCRARDDFRDLAVMYMARTYDSWKKGGEFKVSFVAADSSIRAWQEVNQPLDILARDL
jgi:hypothetical protein